MRGIPSVKLSCRQVRGQLSAYKQGGLSLPKSQQVYAHLVNCRICRSGSRPLTLPAGVLATLGALLFVLGGMYPANPPMVKATSGATGPTGMAYYVRLQVMDRTAAERQIGQILSEAPVLKAKGPYAGRYYMTATSEQLGILMGRLRGIGDPGSVTVGSRRWWPGDPLDPQACSVTLDLLPAG